MKIIEKIKSFKITKKYVLTTYLIKFLFFLILFIVNNCFFHNYITNKLFINEIATKFKREGKININEVENKIKKKNFLNDSNINNIIHIGFTLDPGYTLQTMLTVASIMATQDKQTKIIFHFGVVNNFTAYHMIKMYNLRSKINNLTEFNFYYLRESIEKMKNFHQSGEACPGKFELPQLLSDNIHKLLLFDAGDVLIFRDLTELYNYDMKEFWVLGTPEPAQIYPHKEYNITKYLNIGSLLFNVKELKKNKFWELYTKNRNLKLIGQPDQSLFNIICPDNKKDYFPFRFGGLTPFANDKDSDELKYMNYGINDWLESNYSITFPENPGTQEKIAVNLYNPMFIHQWYGKWHDGGGLSIFRLIAKYFIKLAGIWDELCQIKPGYCK